MAQSLIVQREAAIRRLTIEQAWFAEHGGSLAAYVERYGSAADPEHYGDGGEAIYAADLAAVQRREAEALAIIEKIRKRRALA